ncbi:MAG: Unknown protein [uncultured Thiotrichaceae bacterium]|uniref:UPF0102 protein HELGO_WM36335 n=1 Tax=uncultured Thiotrichaceae bacterium TaxID=298394 RepID=A0A6S6T6H8_9GAMM|nr:MAG: Unknown protein [uncultured Thiotrichaceae bacterium]
MARLLKTTKQIGDHAELVARYYLENQGLVFISANFRSRMGEIDLIMKDIAQESLVFVEVRYRKNATFGGAAVTVNRQKQQRLIKTALFYLQKHAPNACARFDVVAIEGRLPAIIEDIDHSQINWIPNAFQT